MIDKVVKAVFYSKGGRICIIETDETKGHVMGADLVKKALECRHRNGNSVEFTDKGLEGTKFAKCIHPERKKLLSEYCPPMISRIQNESGS